MTLDDPSEAGLLAAHRCQKQIMRDEQALGDFLHPNFLINGPNNRCGQRSHMLQLCQGGAFDTDSHHAQIEKAVVTGNIGIVMGSDLVSPSEGSLLASWFDVKPLRRRFTDTYMFDGGRWLLLARQASVVVEPKKFSG